VPISGANFPVGRGSPSITLDVYGHLIKPDDLQANFKKWLVWSKLEEA